jgi:hypothetical protein
MEQEKRLARIRERRRETKSSSSLERAEAIAKIASYIVTPIVIALTGWWVQSSVADAGIRKDYVAMAMGILKDKSADQQLLIWATQVVKENSPTPLSNELQGKIARSALLVSYASVLLKIPEPPAWFMKAPPRTPEFPEEKLKAGTLTSQQAIELWLADYAAAKRNEIQVRALQDWITITLKAQQEYRQSVIDSEQKRTMESLAGKK